jgi:putative transposase
MPTRLRRYDIPGHTHFLTFSTYRRLTFFWHDAIKQIAVDGLRLLQNKFRICLVGYVIMPEHMHVLIYPHARGDNAPIGISILLHAFKKYTGYEGKKQLRRFAAKDSLWSQPIAEWMKSNQPFWQTRGYDFNIDRHENFLRNCTIAIRIH